MPKKKHLHKKQPGPPDQPTGAKAWFFRLILFFTPVLLLILLELFLRVAGYGTDTRLFVPSDTDSRYLTVNSTLGRLYFPSGQFYPDVSHNFILARKPAGSFRIFVLGGSTARGYPYYNNGSFPSMLRVMLEKSFPNKYFEMVNLSMVAVNSYTVLDILHRAWDYQPDLILIYSGHNEFYGALGVGSVEQLGLSRPLVLLYLKANHYKIFQLVRNAAMGFKKAIGKLSAGKPLQSTLMEHMAGKKKIAYRGPLYRKAVEIFRHNLADIITDCRRHQTPLILGTLTSNVHDQFPFINAFSSPEDSLRWQAIYHRARQMMRENQPDSAETLFQKCIATDSLPAAAYYQAARLAETAGKTDLAYRQFYRAKDMDALRFRAPEDFNGVIRALHRNSSFTLARVKARFEARSPHQIPGKNLFLEHLHPNLQGYFEMAKAFYQAILHSQIMGEPAHPLPPDSLLWPDLGLTRLDREVGKIRIQVLTSGWPFRKGAVGNLNSLNLSGQTYVQKLALRYWKKEITWEKAHVLLAEHYLKNHQYNQAADEFKALIVFTPFNPSPYEHLARIYLQQGRYDDAFPLLRKLTRISGDIFAWRASGKILLLKGFPQKALPYFDRALQIYANDQESLYLAGLANMQTGNTGNALFYLNRLRSLNPKYPGLKELLRQANKQNSRE